MKEVARLPSSHGTSKKNRIHLDNQIPALFECFAEARLTMQKKIHPKNRQHFHTQYKHRVMNAFPRGLSKNCISLSTRALSFCSASATVVLKAASRSNLCSCHQRKKMELSGKQKHKENHCFECFSCSPKAPHFRHHLAHIARHSLTTTQTDDQWCLRQRSCVCVCFYLGLFSQCHSTNSLMSNLSCFWQLWLLGSLWYGDDWEFCRSQLTLWVTSGCLRGFSNDQELSEYMLQVKQSQYLCFCAHKFMCTAMSFLLNTIKQIDVKSKRSVVPGRVTGSSANNKFDWT